MERAHTVSSGARYLKGGRGTPSTTNMRPRVLEKYGLTYERLRVLQTPTKPGYALAEGCSVILLEDGASVIGYAYASRWHARSAYRHTAESTIYLEASMRGRGHGRRLYGALLDEIRRLPIHVVVGGIDAVRQVVGAVGWGGHEIYCADRFRGRLSVPHRRPVHHG